MKMTKNSIFIATRMNLRQSPSLQGNVISILEKNQILPVIEMTEKIDGIIWFRTPQGYVANMDNVYYHSDKYETNNDKIKKFIKDILKKSLKQTTASIEEIIKALENF